MRIFVYWLIVLVSVAVAAGAADFRLVGQDAVVEFEDGAFSQDGSSIKAWPSIGQYLVRGHLFHLNRQQTNIETVRNCFGGFSLDIATIDNRSGVRDLFSGVHIYNKEHVAPESMLSALRYGISHSTSLSGGARGVN
jgi:hypothetical protein